MKLVSMKRTAEDKADDHCTIDGERPDYPWGTRLNLMEEQLDQLGMSNVPIAGSRVAIEAVGLVTGYREEQRDGKTERSLEIQITDMGLAVQGVPMAERMYPDKKDA